MRGMEKSWRQKQTELEAVAAERQVVHRIRAEIERRAFKRPEMTRDDDDTDEDFLMKAAYQSALLELDEWIHEQWPGVRPSLRRAHKEST